MLDRYALQEKLRSVIADYLRTENTVLVDLMFRPKGRRFIVRILVDEPGGGISLDRCAYLNNAIGQLLEQDDLIQDSYLLEVCSPGLDRPLLNSEDFSRCINRKVRIFLNEPQGQTYEVSGVIISVTDSGINLETQAGIRQIPFKQIKKGKQVI
jgi:ribosome maturation factor RimP